MSITSPTQLTLDAFKSIAPKRKGYTFRKENDDYSTVDFSSKQLREEERVIRPQITFQLSLEEIPRIFYRLALLGHRGINALLEDLDPENFNKPLSTTQQAQKKVFEAIFANRNKGLLLRNYFRGNISQSFYGLEDGSLKGFILLFLHYWYELFNSKDRVGREPGLKQYLGIMSRIPLSELYNSLTTTDKQRFIDFMQPHIGFGEICLLRQYNTYAGADVENPLNLSAWFDSIINEHSQKIVSGRKVDLLSPPLNLPTSYSMGAYRLDEANGVALVEARGYSSIKYNDSDLTISQIEDLVKNEADWFFEHKG